MKHRISAFFIAAGAALMLFSLPAFAVDLHQGAYVSGTDTYAYGHNSIPSMPVAGAPQDTDWNRWAMLHDGSVYRLYAFRSGSRDTFYQFGFNAQTGAYEFGYQSIPVLQITSVPKSASTNTFSMLHDGDTYRLYLQDKADPSLLHQFGFNPGSATYEYGHNSIAALRVTGMPADTDWNRWAMLHDGTDYRFYAFKRDSRSQFYQAAYNTSQQQYVFGYQSIPKLTLTGFPQGVSTGSFAMLHDRGDYRVYFND